MSGANADFSFNFLFRFSSKSQLQKERGFFLAMSAFMHRALQFLIVLIIKHKPIIPIIWTAVLFIQDSHLGLR